VSADWYDLGGRLRAARCGQPIARLRHAPAPAPVTPVAVRARSTRHGVTVAAATPSTGEEHATGTDALDMLRRMGVTLTAPTAPTLVIEDGSTVAALHRLARAVGTAHRAEDVAAALAWYADRADYPHGRAVLAVPRACAARWYTGDVPDAERTAATWRRWLTVPDDTTTGMLTLAGIVTAGDPLPYLDTLTEGDAYTWARAADDHTAGRDWRTPDTTARAALGLRDRCNAADLYAAALLTDPLARRRAVHTGHVTTGTAHMLDDRMRRVQVTCPRLDCRLRPGTKITGWVGAPETIAPTWTATVETITATGGTLTITATGVTGAHARPTTGQTVALHAAAPDPWQQRRSRSAYLRLYADRRSWLTTGRTPTPTRREVPLEVLVAGAEQD